MKKFKGQRKTVGLTRYIIKIDDDQAYVFTFKEGTLLNRVKKEMRKVAKAFGYKPVELFNRGAMNLEHLLIKSEIELIEQLEQVINEEAEEKRSSTCSETDSCSTES